MRDDSIYLRLVGHVDNQCNRRRGFAESEMIKGEFLFFCRFISGTAKTRCLEQRQRESGECSDPYFL